MDVTEDFTFPRVSDTYPLTIESPPLWNIPSPAADQAEVIGDDDKYEKDEDTMDLLWENFNEDLCSTSASSTSSSTEMVEVRCGSGALTVMKSNGSAFASNSCKPGTLVLLKLLKKLFSLTNTHRKPTTSTTSEVS
ncbi:hypothetical protein QN277_010843 [Acacia crassicarpa]|uniref:Uncharacterized protein n=1 Tax=Acacia crassicarpa TaxID=499986 RepID=A0AAE1MAZ0_9FABA|nr:hypothetical protein QN277_010843 [Acacia crassicarpa]